MHTNTHRSCSNATEVRTLSQTHDKLIRRCSVHPSQSQIPTVMAMSITAHSLLSRLKLECDVGYDAAVKGTSVVVFEKIKVVEISFQVSFKKSLRSFKIKMVLKWFGKVV